MKTNKNILSNEQETMRLQVVDLELKARYWKAQYDIRHYTLESEKIQAEYDAFLESSRESLMKAIEDAKARGAQATEATEPVEVETNE